MKAETQKKVADSEAKTRGSASRLKSFGARRAAASTAEPLVPGLEGDALAHQAALTLVPPVEDAPPARGGDGAAVSVADPEAPGAESVAGVSVQQAATPSGAPVIEAGLASEESPSAPGEEETPSVEPIEHAGVAAAAAESAMVAESAPVDAAALSGEPEQRGEGPAVAGAAEEESLDEILWQISGPESRLEMSGEPIRKMTLEMPAPLMSALARWELAQMKRTGHRIYRERLFDLALSALPEDPDEVIEIGRSLPPSLKYADTEQLGTRVRESQAVALKILRQEMKVRRTKGVYLRHVYAAAILDFLTRYGVDLEAISEDSA